MENYNKLTEIIKSKDEYKTIADEIKENQFSSCSLILSQDEIYRKIFLNLILKALINSSDNSILNEKIDHKSHSDIIYYGDENNVKVSDALSLCDETYVKPLESDKKILIIENGDNILEEAQNKLLKTLEEPNENVYIIILASSETKLLQTVVSRMKKIVLPILSVDEIAEILKSYDVDDKKANLISMFADGNTTKAMRELQDKEFSEKYEFIKDFINNFSSSKDMLKYAEKITKYKDDLFDIFKMFNDYLGEIIDGKIITQINLYLNGYIELEKLIDESNNNLSNNANVNNVIDNFLIKFLEVRYKWKK
jgi:DNA polymerase III subunit delta'